MIVNRIEQRTRGSKKTVEDAAFRIKHRFDIRNTPIVVDV
jgi:hypothetical protein